MKHLFLIIALLASSLLSQGQTWKFYRHELRLGIGASNFLGELGGANREGTNRLRDFEFSMTRPTFEGSYCYAFNPYLKGRANLLYGRLKGDDKLTSEQFRNNRNLHFKSPVAEFSLLLEYFPFRERIGHLYRLKGTRGKKIEYLSPYLFTGIGGFWFNPKAQDSLGKWTALQPLGTEGQGLPGGPAPYKRLGICIPLGIGLNYTFNKHWSIGFEVSGRITFTDYIDDVSGVYYDNDAIRSSKGNTAAYLANPAKNNQTLINSLGYDPTNTGYQRGDSNDNDSYLFAIFSVHYRLLKGRLVLPKF